MRRRLLLSTLGVALVAVLVLGLPLLFVTVRLIGNIARNDLLRETQTVQSYVEDRLAAANGDETRIRLTQLVPASQRIVVRLPSKNILVEGPDPGADALTQTVALPDGGSVSVSRPIGHLRADQLRAGLVVLVLALISAAVAAFVAVLTARRLSGPFLAMAARAARIGDGDFRVSTRRYGIPELDRVLDVLDRSATEIAALVRRERDLASDISHQLRTRLTALRMRLEEIALSDDPEVREEATEALEQAERLSGVVDELLADARQARAADAELIDVEQEVSTILREYQPAISAAGRELRSRLQTGLFAMATPGRLHQAVGVLVDNSVQHGSGLIEVTTRGSGQNVVIEVGDEGAGVDPAVVPQLFQRGVSAGGGTGLGLALARALVEADGGRLELRRSSPPLFAVFLTRNVPESGGAGSESGGAGSESGGAGDGSGGAGDGSGGAGSEPDAGGLAGRRGSFVAHEHPSLVRPEPEHSPDPDADDVRDVE